MFCFWPLKRIIEEFEESTDKNFIGVCDFLIASHMVGFVRDSEGVFKSYNDFENEKIAETYQEVVKMINSSADKIY